jgi:hypothetical protein
VALDALHENCSGSTQSAACAAPWRSDQGLGAGRRWPPPTRLPGVRRHSHGAVPLLCEAHQLQEGPGRLGYPLPAQGRPLWRGQWLPQNQAPRQRAEWLPTSPLASRLPPAFRRLSLWIGVTSKTFPSSWRRSQTSSQARQGARLQRGGLLANRGDLRPRGWLLIRWRPPPPPPPSPAAPPPPPAPAAPPLQMLLLADVKALALQKHGSWEALQKKLGTFQIKECAHNFKSGLLRQAGTPLADCNGLLQPFHTLLLATQPPSGQGVGAAAGCASQRAGRARRAARQDRGHAESAGRLPLCGSGVGRSLLQIKKISTEGWAKASPLLTHTTFDNSHHNCCRGHRTPFHCPQLPGVVGAAAGCCRSAGALGLPACWPRPAPLLSRAGGGDGGKRGQGEGWARAQVSQNHLLRQGLKLRAKPPRWAFRNPPLTRNASQQYHQGGARRGGLQAQPGNGGRPAEMGGRAAQPHGEASAQLPFNHAAAYCGGIVACTEDSV